MTPADLDTTLQSHFILRELLANEGGGWDLLTGVGPASYIQKGALVGRRAGIGVRANPLQHAGRGPVVEGQLPGAVAAHSDPHRPQQHGQTGQGPLSWGHYGRIMKGLRLKEEETEGESVIRGMFRVNVKDKHIKVAENKNDHRVRIC